jgi:hypothetical protein
MTLNKHGDEEGLQVNGSHISPFLLMTLNKHGVDEEGFNEI